MIDWCSSRRFLKHGSILLALVGLLLSSPAFACAMMTTDGTGTAMPGASVQHDLSAWNHDAMPMPDDAGQYADCCAACPAGWRHFARHGHADRVPA